LNKPRIFLGSSGKQADLLEAITDGIEDVVDVEPWTTTFNPGRSTLDRLVELSQQVDFAAFVFAQDDWTTTDMSEAGQASPRDNVVFEAGLFGSALGIRRTFILHASGSKLPTDLLGLTTIRYDPTGGEAEVNAINEKLRKAIETEGRRGPDEGLWWQLSLTLRSEEEPSAVSQIGSRSHAQRTHVRRLPTRRSVRPRRAGQRQRRGAGRANCQAPEGVEVGCERLLIKGEAQTRTGIERPISSISGRRETTPTGGEQ
jgi:hypothetical protein